MEQIARLQHQVLVHNADQLTARLGLDVRSNRWICGSAVLYHFLGTLHVIRE